jgi:hypothetical protein
MADRGTGWGLKFDEPVALLDGRALVTLRDAANYVTKLPRSWRRLQFKVRPRWRKHALGELRQPFSIPAQ